MSDKKDKLGIVKFSEVYGKRENKFLFLNDVELNSVSWKKLELSEPKLFFSPIGLRIFSRL
ncbi:MAG: hypothetical protein M5T52_24185 [Ignavibacteriaceae bacterium]|nr:hypothetical protein [Ignavibacteriaceae bacterium]